MELPPIGTEPSEQWWAQFHALPLKEKLKVTVAMAERLNTMVSQAFPLAAKSVQAKVEEVRKLPLEQRLAEGERASQKLAALALKLAPEATLDKLDEQLPTDEASRTAAQEVLARMRTAR